jgi:hypothetical protein
MPIWEYVNTSVTKWGNDLSSRRKNDVPPGESEENAGVEYTVD